MIMNIKEVYKNIKSDPLQNIALILFCIVIFGVCFQGLISVWSTNLLSNYADFGKAWKEILLILCSFILIADISIKKKWKDFFEHKIAWLTLCFIALSLVYLVIFNNPALNEMAGLLISLRIYGSLAIGYILCKNKPNACNIILFSAILGILINLVFGFLQITILPKEFLEIFGYSHNSIEPYLTVDKNPEFIRIAGLLRGPNPFGVLMMLASTLSLAAIFYLKQSKKIKNKSKYIYLALILLLISIILTWNSYSRSAFGAMILNLAIFTSLFIEWNKKTLIRFGIGLSSAVIIFVSLIFIFKDNSFVQHTVFHTNPDGGSAIKSDQARGRVLESSFNSVLKRPQGYGVGSSGSASFIETEKQGNMIENQYISFAYETGIVGFLLQISIFSLVIFYLYKIYRDKKYIFALAIFSVGVGCFLVGFVLPVWMDDTVAIVWWGLAGSIIGSKLE